MAAKPYRVIAADAADLGDLGAKLDGFAESPEVLVHCLSGNHGRSAEAYRVIYVETLRHLLDVVRPQFVVFTSSTSVYPQEDATLVDENSPVGGTPTGDVLIEAEQLALASGGAAVRLGGIYGPGRARFVEAALSGQPIPFGAPEGFVNLIHRDDAARALFLVGSERRTGIFNAVDDRPARRMDLAQAIRSGMPLASDDTGAAVGKRVSNAKLRAAGWAPSYPTLLDALPQLVAPAA